MIDALELDELRARDVLGEIAAMADVAVDVVLPVQHEGRHLDRRQDRTHVDLGVHAEVGERVAGPMRQPLVLAPPAPKRLVRDARGRHLRAGRCRSPTHRRSADRSRPSIRGSAPRDIRRAAWVTRMTHRARSRASAPDTRPRTGWPSVLPATSRRSPPTTTRSHPERRGDRRSGLPSAVARVPDQRDRPRVRRRR